MGVNEGMVDPENFEKWVRFAFDRKVHPRHRSKYSDQPKKDRGKDWYFQDKWSRQYDPKVLVRNVIRLFSRPSNFDRFSDDQVNQGLYYLAFGANLPDVLTNKSVPLSLRVRCVESMGELYAGVFEKREIEDSAFMWWDWFEGVPRNWKRGPLTANGKALLKAMLDTLEGILKLKNHYCLRGALHGLGHQKTVRSRAIIQRFLRRNRDLDLHLKIYARECATRNIV
ncbi:MAG TPA: hypothetical protein VHE12_00375 [bacterium]|nr:hypothetical protein [bacterium]